MISKKFFASSFIYTFSSSLSIFSSFLLLPFYTNTKLLNVSDYGALVLYMALTLFVQSIAGLSMESYAGVAYYNLKGNPQELKRKLASLNGYLIFVGLAIFILFALLSKFFITSLVPGSNSSAYRYVLMSVLTGIFNAHFKFYNAVLSNSERPWRYLISNVLNFVSTIAISLIVLFKFPLTLEGPLWGRLLSGVCIFAMSFGDITLSYGLAFHKKYLAPTFKFCFPLVLTALFQWVLANSDRYIIQPLLHNNEVGIFDLAVKFTMFITLVLEGLGTAMTPKIFGLMKDAADPLVQKNINKYYSSFNLIALLVIPANILLLPIFLPVFLGNERYYEAFLYFGLVGGGIITRSVLTLFVNPLYYYRETNKLLLVNGISAALQLVVTYFMVRYFKLQGAAIGLNIVKVLQLVLFFFVAGSFVTPGVNIKKMVVLPALALTITSVGELFITKYGIVMHAIHGAELILIVILAWAFYRNEIKELLVWSKNKWLPGFISI